MKVDDGILDNEMRLLLSKARSIWPTETFLRVECLDDLSGQLTCDEQNEPKSLLYFDSLKELNDKLDAIVEYKELKGD